MVVVVVLCVCAYCAFWGGEGEEKIMEINVEKFMTFREGNNSHLKAA